MADHDTHDHTGVPGVGTPALLAIASISPGNIDGTSSSFADLDATNAKVVFTAPASGKIVVICTGIVSPDNGGSVNGALAYWGLRESTTNLTGADEIVCRSVIVSATANFTTITKHFYLTGVSAGSHTYKWSYKVTGGATMRLAATSTSPALMEVWSAP